MLPHDPKLVAIGQVLEHAQDFQRSAAGHGLLTPNSNRLVEIAVIEGRADHELHLTIGIPIETFP